MSFGQLYGFRGNARSMVLLAIAAENKLDIEFIETNPDFELSDEYLKLNPLRQVPAFRAPDGWYLTEAIAIALHFTTQNRDTTLLGQTPREYVEIIRWMSLVNSEVQPHLANWFKPLVRRRAYNEANVDKARTLTNKAIAIIEAHLATDERTYFVGEGITLADLFAASSFSRGFQYVFDLAWQQDYPNVTRWFKHFVNQPIWKRVVPEPIIVEKAVEYGNDKQ